MESIRTRSVVAENTEHRSNDKNVQQTKFKILKIKDMRQSQVQREPQTDKSPQKHSLKAKCGDRHGIFSMRSRPVRAFIHSETWDPVSKKKSNLWIQLHSFECYNNLKAFIWPGPPVTSGSMNCPGWRKISPWGVAVPKSPLFPME